MPNTSRQFSITICFSSQEIQQRAVKLVCRFQVRDVSNALEFDEAAVRNVMRRRLSKLRVLPKRAADFFAHVISANHRSIFLPDDEQRRYTNQIELMADGLLINHLIRQRRCTRPTRKLAA